MPYKAFNSFNTSLEGAYIMQVITKNNIRDTEDKLFTAGYIRHHVASMRGYVSRRTAGYIEPYRGKFGVGVRWVYPRYDTSRYCYVEYCVYLSKAVQELHEVQEVQK